MRRLWAAFVMVSVIGFGILGWVGSRIYQEAPPIPERVLTADGSVVAPNGDIGRGQNVWQTMGGMEGGSVWGHGRYVATDWTADWLHRETVFILNDWARAEADVRTSSPRRNCPS
jgi:nitric oxide reductase subunit B